MSFFKCKRILITLLLVFITIFSFNVFNFNLNVNTYTYASIEDINYAIKNKTFGKFCSVNINNNIYASDNGDLLKVDVKFLNLITVKSFYVNTNEEFLYAGGNAVGIYLNTKGVMLIGNNSIITKDGLVDTLKESELQIGDILLKINDESICDIDDIIENINLGKNKGKPAKITYLRKNKEYETYLNPAFDIESNSYKLGIWVKNDASGVGTLTYISEDG